MLTEHHTCLSELISNLQELHKSEGSEIDETQYIHDFIMASGNGHLLSAVQFLQLHGEQAQRFNDSSMDALIPNPSAQGESSSNQNGSASQNNK